MVFDVSLVSECREAVESAGAVTKKAGSGAEKKESGERTGARIFLQISYYVCKIMRVLGLCQYISV